MGQRSINYIIFKNFNHLKIIKLYFEFAEKFDLFQCQLAIFKMARHDDPKIVEVFWKQIIATGK